MICKITFFYQLLKLVVKILKTDLLFVSFRLYRESNSLSDRFSNMSALI